MSPNAWFYVDGWDWVFNGQEYTWQKVYSKQFQTNDLNVVEANRRGAFHKLNTEQAVLRCFVWAERTPGGGYEWITCEETGA